MYANNRQSDPSDDNMGEPGGDTESLLVRQQRHQHPFDRPPSANRQVNDWEGGYGSMGMPVYVPTRQYAQQQQQQQLQHSPQNHSYTPAIYQNIWSQQTLPPPPPPPPQPTFRPRNTSNSPQGRHPQHHGHGGGISEYVHAIDIQTYQQQQQSYQQQHQYATQEATRQDDIYRNNHNALHQYQMQQQLTSGRNKSRSRGEIKKVASFNELPPGEEETKRPPHRRNNSDFNYQRKNVEQHHRSPLPLHPFQRKSATPGHNRIRSWSAGGVPKPRHRRVDSSSSAASMSSVLSDRSIITDITKSALYKGETMSGMVRFHSPLDNVKLVMDANLKPGAFYRVCGGIDEEERYFEYTRHSEGHNDFEYMDQDNCVCDCAACSKCTHKMEQMLYPTKYVLRVNDDLYQRVMGEVADSKQPCGLFFCGHHEDVKKPSILIAVVIIGTFFGALLIMTFFSGGS